MKCVRKDCDCQATHSLVMTLRLSGCAGSFVGVANVFACDDHADKELAEELFNSNAGHHLIEKQMTANGLPAPDWDNSTIEWVKVVHQEVRHAATLH